MEDHPLEPLLLADIPQLALEDLGEIDEVADRRVVQLILLRPLEEPAELRKIGLGQLQMPAAGAAIFVLGCLRGMPGR